MNIIVEIPKYIREVKFSNSRMAKYYILGKSPHPTAKKYQDRDKYEWVKIDKKTYLVEKATGQKVLANPKSCGTANIESINGQKIYNGATGQHYRNKIMGEIKTSFRPYIDALDPITDPNSFPLKIELEIHDTIRTGTGKSLWDADNRTWPYIKAFQDCLTGNKGKDGKLRNKQIIPDDNILFVTQPPSVKFIPVEKEEDRKLVFKIQKETDERIIGNSNFMEELKKELNGF